MVLCICSTEEGECGRKPTLPSLVTWYNDCRTTLESYNLTGEVSVGSVVTLPFSLGSVHTMSENQLLLTEFESPRYVCVSIQTTDKKDIKRYF